MNQNNPENIQWYEETILYLLDINGNVKFGITSDWQKRQKAYKKEIVGEIINKL